MAGVSEAPPQGYGPFGRIRAELVFHLRFYTALAIGVCVWLATRGLHEGLRALLAADLFFAIYIALMLAEASSLDAEGLRARGERWRRRPRAGGGFVMLITFLAMLVSLWAIFVLLNHPRDEGSLFPILAIASVPLSWGMTHTLAAYQYATIYYTPGRDGRPAGGLDFAGGAAPDAWDFLYQALVVGASFSVSDVPASTRLMRRAIMIHSLAAFAFNTVLIAITVNAALAFVR